MRVREFMTRNVETVEERVPASEAAERMRASRIRHLVVVRGREVRGVLSDRDVAGAADGPVGGLMIEDPVTAAPDDTLRRAANLLRGNRVGCLPVVDGGRVVGIVTTTDILDLVGRGAERPVAESLRRDLTKRGPRRKPAGGVRRARR
jgi:acetoin utilization protein AcuB